MKLSLVPALAMCLATAAYADTRMKVRYTTGGESNETVVASKAARQRMEYINTVVIQQPDLNRFLQVDPQAKAYTVVPMNSTVPPAATASKRGSMVTVSTNTTNTGETKQMLGQVARHVKTVTVRQPMPGACDSTQSSIEIDGWYIDLPGDQSLPASGGAEAAVEPACKDEYRYESNGEPNTGFPVAYTMTVRDGKKSTTTSMEVLELTTAPLDAALFEAPAGYTEARDPSDFARRQAVAETFSAPAKAAGNVRVGFLGTADRSGRSLNQEYLTGQLQRALKGAGVDVVRVMDPDQAKQAGCDYVLSSEVGQLKKSAIGQAAGQAAKVSGLLRGGLMRGGPSATAAPADEQVEAHVDYHLTPLADGKPETNASVSAKTGSVISLKTALTLAANVTPMLMMAQMASSMYSLQVMSQAGSQSMGMDQTLAGVSSWSMAAGAIADRQAPPAAEGKAIAAAFELAAKGIAAAVK